MNPRFEKPRPPVLLDEAFDDPDRIRAMVRANAPYWPVLRYVAKPEELAAVSRSRPSDPQVLPPVAAPVAEQHRQRAVSRLQGQWGGETRLRA